MHKIHNKTQKQQQNYKCNLVVETAPRSPNSRSSLSLTSAQEKLKLKLLTKMSQSLKPLGLLQNQINSEEIGDKTERNADGNNPNNLSMRKSKKMSESHYYQISKKQKPTENRNNISKRKASGVQSKAQSHQNVLDYKSSKSKIYEKRKTQKVKLVPRPNPESSSNQHQHSMKRLMSTTEISDKLTKLQTVRTFSPEMELVSQNLSQKRKQKKIANQKAQLLQRVQQVFEEYRKAIIRQQKQKQCLVKQNRKLKEKLQILNSEKKYKAVFQYKA